MLNCLIYISLFIKAIDKIDTYSACGEDDIPAMVLKNCKLKLSYPIMLIWRHSGYIHQQYKNQIIAPVHKKNCKATPANYRPISLTSHIIKIFERVIKRKLVFYLENNKLICSSQHGFRKNKSCLTQLLVHIDNILENFLHGNDTDSLPWLC